MPRRPFRLQAQTTALFDEGDTKGFYYIIRSRDGDELARSTNAPQHVTYLSKTGPYGTLNATPESRLGEIPPSRTLGSLRESFTTTPPGETILVGRSIAPELNELRHTSLKLAGVGGVILMFGFVGGWWLASRTIHPIESISATALKISAGDLSQRINIEDTDSELGQLAGVLNSTFARLDAAFAQQSRFTADAAHELRTPITVMLTQTQSALARTREAADYRETIEACQRATQRMRRLIESLLELARLDAGQETMKRMNFDLCSTASECVEAITPLAAERGIRFDCNLEPAQSSGDPERIAQVITNLLTNAIHYNRDNGEVHIRTAQRDGVATLTVSDTGNGISRDDLPHIFERFYRAEKSRSTGRTGLGLAISKAIVEAHGGTIEVASELDKGTTFTVRLPLN
jgi:heavy metal sensor kinase